LLLLEEWGISGEVAEKVACEEHPEGMFFGPWERLSRTIHVNTTWVNPRAASTFPHSKGQMRRLKCLFTNCVSEISDESSDMPLNIFRKQGKDG
jgi:hypothetical protein